MGHGRKFRAKLQPTAPLIRARPFRIQTPSVATLRRNCVRIETYEVAFARTSDKALFDATGRDFSNVAANELLKREWDNEILFFGRFQVDRTLTEI